ncbi:GNAT family N-acetyltransferase [Alkalicoccus luteus]|uniref:GNAT family N-acetyltransferase n=1 Tax=Alkalicoccus luteus TaxID=1237094 RepID=UPI004034A3E5
MMNVERLEEWDAAAYFQLRLQALQMHPEAFATSLDEEAKHGVEKFKKRFQESKAWTYGAFDGERLCGVITLFPQQLKKVQHRAEITAFFVHPSMRRHGIGRRLLEAVWEAAEDDAYIEQLNLYVTAQNHAAISLYEEFGFSVTGREVEALFVDGVYYDELRMTAKLEESL